MRSGKSIGAISRALLAVLVIGTFAITVFGWKYWMRPPTKPDADVGRAVAQTFLDTLREKRAGDAWNSTTAEFKSIEGRESFVRSASKQPLLKERLQFVSMQEVRVKEEPRAEYIFQSPAGKMVRVLVGHEASVWKVDRLTL